MFFLQSTKLLKYVPNYILGSVLCILLFGTLTPRPFNLTDARNKVEEYYECGKYDKETDKVVNKAIRHFKKIAVTCNSVVIFDIDETVLSNYCDEKAISFGYIPKLSHEWIMKAKMPSIPQTKRLYDYLVCRGFRIIFLSGRKHNEYDVTIKNLKEQGFHEFDLLIVRSLEEEKLTAQEYKTNRRRLLMQSGYKIVGMVGDQCSDLVGYSEYMLKIPNYRYRID